MNYRTTAKNAELGEGKILAWSESAGVYFIGDDKGDGQGEAKFVSEGIVEHWWTEGWVEKMEGGAE